MTDQCRAILEYLDDYGSITPLEAMRDLGIMRLAARIHDLASTYGVVFERETVYDWNRNGDKIHYTRYRRAMTEDGRPIYQTV